MIATKRYNYNLILHCACLHKSSAISNLTHTSSVMPCRWISTYTNFMSISKWTKVILNQKKQINRKESERKNQNSFYIQDRDAPFSILRKLLGTKFPDFNLSIPLFVSSLKTSFFFCLVLLPHTFIIFIICTWGKRDAVINYDDTSAKSED